MGSQGPFSEQKTTCSETGNESGEVTEENASESSDGIKYSCLDLVAPLRAALASGPKCKQDNELSHKSLSFLAQLSLLQDINLTLVSHPGKYFPGSGA